MCQFLDIRFLFIYLFIFLISWSLTKLEQGVGIEPTLGPHLGHTGYKSVGASNYTNLALNLIGSYNIFRYGARSFLIELKLIFIIWRFRVHKCDRRVELYYLAKNHSQITGRTFRPVGDILIWKKIIRKSGREDLNLRPPGPKPGALPS